MLMLMRRARGFTPCRYVDVRCFDMARRGSARCCESERVYVAVTLLRAAATRCA